LEYKITISAPERTVHHWTGQRYYNTASIPRPDLTTSTRKEGQGYQTTVSLGERYLSDGTDLVANYKPNPVTNGWTRTR